MKLSFRGKTFILCWCVYVCAYVCRVNIAIALPQIRETFQGGMELAGIIGSVFFAVYAVGQLVNGYLGDRLPPRRFVAVALMGTALMNLVIGLSDNLAVIAVCWGVNGYFQSMIWGPLMRILSRLFTGREQRSVSAGMSTTMVIGYALAWTVLGRVILFASWKWLFLIPAGVGTCMAAVWLLIMGKQTTGTEQAKGKARTIGESLRFITDRRLWFLVSACCMMGVIKEGISLWAPMLFSEFVGLDLSSSLSLLLIIPIANLGGIYASWRLHRLTGRRDLYPVLWMLGVILLCTGLLIRPPAFPRVFTALFIAAISAMSYGCNSIFLSLIPLRYSTDNMVSSLAGILDFSTYCGAAASSLITGILVSASGWSRVPVLWLSAGLLAGLLLVLQLRTESSPAKPVKISQEVSS